MLDDQLSPRGACSQFGLGAELLVIRLPPGDSLGELFADWLVWASSSQGPPRAIAINSPGSPSRALETKTDIFLLERAIRDAYQAAALVKAQSVLQIGLVACLAPPKPLPAG